MKFAAALHTYFSVEDVTKVQVGSEGGECGQERWLAGVASLVLPA